MARRIITLTTDFGAADHFVGAMKGVILGIAPLAEIVDISHEVQPFEVTEGAFTIAQAYRYFPKRAIHVIVVDPGVGSARRPLLAEMGGQYFLAPDNGVLSMVYAREQPGAQGKPDRPAKVRHIQNDRYFLQPVSRTFHGRDVFAPVAAHLASGIAPPRFGNLVGDYLRLAFDKPARTGKRVWTGAVLKVDRFGNLITNFHIDDFAGLGARPFELNIGLEKIARLAQTFSEGEPGERFAVVGSSGYLEVAANRGSAAKTLGCGAGSPVELILY